MGEDLTHANAFSNNLDGQRWENHFKNLFTKTGGDINNTMKKSHSPTNVTLNEKSHSPTNVTLNEKSHSAN